MVDWHSTTTLLANVQMTVHLVHFLAGIYLWDFLSTLSFDYDFLTRKKQFRWPLIFYFANRYSMLAFYITIILFNNNPKDHRIDCKVTFAFLHSFGGFARGLASINLALRTIAVWSQNRFIIGVLCLMILGQWVIIIVDVRLADATWVDGKGCLVLNDNWFWLTALFIYSMCFDLTILLLTGYKLANGVAGRSWNMQHRLTNLIFKQGLSFYLSSFLADLLAIIFLVLNLNIAMASLFTIPAELVSTLVACRAVRNLTNIRYESQNTNPRENTFSGSSGAHQTSRPKRISFRNKRLDQAKDTSVKDGVLIEMQSSLTHDTDSKAVELAASSR